MKKRLKKAIKRYSVHKESNDAMFNRMLDIFNKFEQECRKDLSTLRDFSYEDRPKELERLSKKDFDSLREFMPYYCLEQDGQVHFYSDIHFGRVGDGT